MTKLQHAANCALWLLNQDNPTIEDVARIKKQLEEVAVPCQAGNFKSWYLIQETGEDRILKQLDTTKEVVSNYLESNMFIEGKMDEAEDTICLTISLRNQKC